MNQYQIIRYDNHYHGNNRNLRSCLEELGMKRSESENFYKRHHKREDLWITRDYAIKAIRPVHPDKHLQDKEYYTGLVKKKINAFNRAKQLIDKIREPDIYYMLERRWY